MDGHENPALNSLDPGFFNVYRALAMADVTDSGNVILGWLNANGLSNLTVCPMCNGDAFTHTDSCQVGAILGHAASILEKRKPDIEQDVRRVMSPLKRPAHKRKGSPSRGVPFVRPAET